MAQDCNSSISYLNWEWTRGSKIRQHISTTQAPPQDARKSNAAASSDEYLHPSTPLRLPLSATDCSTRAGLGHLSVCTFISSFSDIILSLQRRMTITTFLTCTRFILVIRFSVPAPHEGKNSCVLASACSPGHARPAPVGFTLRIAFWQSVRAIYPYDVNAAHERLYWRAKGMDK